MSEEVDWVKEALNEEIDKLEDWQRLMWERAGDGDKHLMRVLFMSGVSVGMRAISKKVEDASNG